MSNNWQKSHHGHASEYQVATSVTPSDFPVLTGSDRFTGVE